MKLRRANGIIAFIIGAGTGLLTQLFIQKKEVSVVTALVSGGSFYALLNQFTRAKKKKR